jgi:hypothetical protein
MRRPDKLDMRPVAVMSVWAVIWAVVSLLILPLILALILALILPLGTFPLVLEWRRVTHNAQNKAYQPRKTLLEPASSAGKEPRWSSHAISTTISSFPRCCPAVGKPAELDRPYSVLCKYSC